MVAFNTNAVASFKQPEAPFIRFHAARAALWACGFPAMFGGLYARPDQIINDARVDHASPNKSEIAFDDVRRSFVPALRIGMS